MSNILTIVDIAINVVESASTVGNIFPPVALVFSTIRPDLDTYKFRF